MVLGKVTTPSKKPGITIEDGWSSGLIDLFVNFVAGYVVDIDS